MPIQKGIENDKPYYRWGDKGKKYFYVAGNKLTRDYAKEKALKQGKAIQFFKHRNK